MSGQAAAFLVLLTTATVARTGPPSNLDARFARLDANRDGAVTWQEAYRRRVRDFVEMDTDRDGLVDHREFAAGAQPFEAFDADRDGRLQLAEFIGGHHSMFARLDRDGDERLRLREYRQAMQTARHDG